MKKAIVTTTINPPTEALKKFIKIAKNDDWHLFIVGDLKTPHSDYQDIASVMDCVTYLTPDDQNVISLELSKLIGWNCIQRRNFGLIAAYRWGAEIIATIDDDNIPYEGWGKNCRVNKEVDVSIYHTKQPVFDPISPFLGQIWHRGFPIQDLDTRTIPNPRLGRRKVLVQADFWDGSPDVDAICRITLNPMVKFPPSMIPMAADTLMPFNSQNTFLSREVLPEYFLYPHVGRMDDIWAAYWMQSKFPDSVIFSKASVNQVRNEHDLTKDLEAELLGYKHNAEIVRDPQNAITKYLPEDAAKAYDVYKQLLTNSPTTGE